MEQNLLILGAGIYGDLAGEIARSMGVFQRIAFVDDRAAQTANGCPVIGTTEDLPALAGEFTHAVVAIGNPAVREKLLGRIVEETSLELATLISPAAYVSPSARIGAGCVIEPMSVVHTAAVLGKGCLICAGAVVNHAAVCGDFVQVDCNATVAGNISVPAGSKIPSGTVCRG